MKTVLTAFALILMMGVAAPSSAARVGVSISLGQPNFYGRIDLGDMARPPVVYDRVRVVDRRSRYANSEPVYLRVPPGHQRNWSRYCGRYDACGRPVYFVRDNWYREQYVPQYEARQNRGRGNGHGNGKDKDKGNGRGNGNGHHNDEHDDRGRGHDRD